MAKNKLGRYMFRKIRGRVIPIRIKNTPDRIAQGSEYGNKIRKIEAVSDKEYMGSMSLYVPKKGKSATVQDVRVRKEYRRRGISKNLFARATQMLERANYKFLRSDEMMSAAQVKIRKNYGRYKAGGKRKNRTKFFADGFGPYGEQTRRISSKEAIEIINQNKSAFSRGQKVTATTMLKKLPKKYRKKK